MFEGAIDYLQVLDEQGNVDQANFPKDLTDQKIVEMYKYMLFARALDAKMLSLQRQGRAATYAPLIGEEATQIGSAFAFRQQDVFVPNFRQHGVFLARGFPLDNFFIYWKGYEDGGKVPENFNGTAVCVPVASQMPHATGIAFALKHMNKDAAVISYVGDGGTSEGDFYEAINFAGVWKTPLVSIIENNQWAISVPRKDQSAAQTLAQKAFAAGIKGVQVDGNDLFAVYKAVSDAIASSKSGPTLIECVTYRMSMHTTSDDPTKYRTEEEVAEWKKRDPIARVKAYLVRKNLWNDEMEKQTGDEQLKKIDEAVENAEQFKPDPRSMYENVYSFMPDTLKAELDAATAANFWQ
ncbi:MAG: pyruvate dehydrogenase (acetyl-transferring) E1 component subunit alpha [Candidatus Marsarchaeota archaeon]|nr:pyruvate dehydrogenase (acetyl-transferring) E1 component subunit alpha [Candidatus Marsarchaeota archaeon]